MHLSAAALPANWLVTSRALRDDYKKQSEQVMEGWALKVLRPAKRGQWWVRLLGPLDSLLSLLGPLGSLLLLMRVGGNR